MLLQDKIAIITGGGQGIGREIALAYAKAGAKVVLAARSAAPLEETRTTIEALGGQALVIPTDISDQARVQHLAETTVDHYGRVDILVNNSGIGGPSTPLWKIEPREWQKTFDVNVLGTFLCCRAILPNMIERQSGAIVIIGSMAGKRPLLNRTAYAASKAALIGLVRTLAWETGSYNIRVNMISPGATAGPRIEWSFRSQAEAQGITLDEARRQFTSASPLDKLVDPGHVANTAVFLASEMAASITGEDVNVSAGSVMY